MGKVEQRGQTRSTIAGESRVDYAVLVPFLDKGTDVSDCPRTASCFGCGSLSPQPSPRERGNEVIVGRLRKLRTVDRFCEDLGLSGAETQAHRPKVTELSIDGPPAREPDNMVG